MLLRGVKGEEPKVPSGSIPKELKDVAKSEFIQRNDGKTGKLIVFEVPSGKVLREHDTFYTSDGAKTDMGLAGSLRDGARVGLPSWESVPFSLDRLPGWPEYFTRFVFHPDGTGYGVTTAYRLVKITKEGKIEKAVPVF